MQEKNDIRFSISNKEQFSFRSALLLIHDKSILLERDQGNGDLEVYVPGGAVQFSETAEQAISREMREELGVKLISPEFAGILESFWSRDAISYHQLTIVFRQQVDEMLFSDLDHLNYRDLDVSAQAKMAWYSLAEAAQVMQPKGLLNFASFGSPLRHEIEID